MPKLLKMRLVNIDYAGGTRIIPDLPFDMTDGSGNATNTLLNLDNGGGKTTIIHFIAQIFSPNAPLGKRKIVDNFIKPNSHSFVALEFEKDGGAGRFMIGIAISAVRKKNDYEIRENEGTVNDSDRIKYYNFVTEYDGYSPYSIDNLEFSKKNGNLIVPADYEYMMSVETQSRGLVATYSAAQREAWKEKLLEYGLSVAEWKSVIIRVNSDETKGISQFFEDAKNSRGIIKDFIVPVIEDRINNKASNDVDHSLSRIFLNYSEEVKNYDQSIAQKGYLDSVVDRLQKVRDDNTAISEMYNNYIHSCDESYGLYEQLNKAILSDKETHANLENELNNSSSMIEHIKFEKISAAYYEALDKYNDIKEEYDRKKAEYDRITEHYEELQAQDRMLSCAKLYQDKRAKNSEIEALYSQIKAREENSDNAKELRRTGYSYKLVLEKELANCNASIEKYNAEIKDLEAELQRNQMTLDSLEKELSVISEKRARSDEGLTIIKTSTDQKIEQAGLDVVRKLDGFYGAEEVLEIKDAQTKEIARLRGKISAGENKRKQLETHIFNDIPDRVAEIAKEKSNVENDIKRCSDELAVYNELYTRLEPVCEKYELRTSHLFSKQVEYKIEEYLAKLHTDISAFSNELSQLNRKCEAAKEGYLHIVPEIYDYIESLGLECQTAEDYLCTQVEKGLLSNEDLHDILSNYPFVAYSLILSSKDMATLQDSDSDIWFSAAVPLITNDDLEDILNGNYVANEFLAHYDEEFFSSRDHYIGNISNKIRDLKIRRDELLSEEKSSQSELELVKSFTYAEDWHDKKNDTLNSLNQKVSDLNNELVALSDEKEQCCRDKEEVESELKDFRKKIDKVNTVLRIVCEIEELMTKEQEVFDEYQNYCKLYKEKNSEIERLNRASSELSEQIEHTNESLESLEINHEKYAKEYEQVSYFEPVDDVIDNDWVELYHRYSTLKKTINNDIQPLRNEIDTLQEGIIRIEKEISAYNLAEEDIKNVDYSEDIKANTVQELRRYKGFYNLARDEYDDISSDFSKAEGVFEEKKKELQGEEALSRNEVGTDFDGRIKELEKENKKRRQALSEISERIRNFQDYSGRIYDVLGDYEAENILEVEIESDLKSQWTNFRKNMQTTKDRYVHKNDLLINSIKDIIEQYDGLLRNNLVDNLKSLVGQLSSLKSKPWFTFVEDCFSGFIDSLNKERKQLDDELSHIDDDFKYLVEQCLQQAERIYNDIKIISNSSKIRLWGPNAPLVQMVHIGIKDKREISDELARVNMENYLRASVEKVKTLLQDESDSSNIMKKVNKYVSGDELLYVYLNQKDIVVKLYKVDLIQRNSKPVPYDEIVKGKSSNGEKLFSYFTLLASLMGYTKTTEGILDKNVYSFLPLDNPFGEMYSEHLLGPFFNVAEHFRIQTLCFSGLNQASVIKNFNNVIKSKLLVQGYSSRGFLTIEETIKKAPEENVAVLDNMFYRYHEVNEIADVEDDTDNEAI